MRFLLRVLPLLVLAAACTKIAFSPRLDFVGATRFISASRIITTGTVTADSLASKIYAQTTNLDDGPNLKHLRITLASSPTRTPVLYPTTISTYLASSTPDDPPLVYLDSLLAPGTKDIAFTNLLTGRTASGVDSWKYAVTDETGSIASRAYRLSLRRTDSLTAVVHSYRAYFGSVPVGQPGTPLTAAQNQALAYVNLRQGLLLPHFAVAYTNPESVASRAANRALVDLVCTTQGPTLRLVSTKSGSLVTTGWGVNTHSTALRATTLAATDFIGLTTNALLASTFATGTVAGGDSLQTAPLVKGAVIAFHTTATGPGGAKYGALLIADLVRTPATVITCQVLVQK
ncbi:hypothetical protein [Hymenobacter sp. PAMC 26628]|uniref:hypothetical protein n=1 Tax=Hymenobacter sp. PAMC 26628 TaxID=1484118 RepID=UPI000770511C|nr:hypothetical protein [Hymenobacter sp. PAMC 26628]AMJ67567.1 hypothetical protein AXW84_20710 [Hymenobacter sp. PAMC 26628]